MTAEMRFQVPPKTFRLDSWITELDQATNLVVTVVPNRQALDWESPSAKSAATKPRIFSLRSTVTSTIIDSRFTSRLVIVSFVNSNLLAIEPLGAYLRLRHYEMIENLNCSEFHPS